jgi:hypothetical protein
MVIQDVASGILCQVHSSTSRRKSIATVAENRYPRPAFSETSEECDMLNRTLRVS